MPIGKLISPNIELVTRSTSLVSETFVDLLEGAVFDLALRESDSLVAIVADFSRCHGNLVLSGQNHIRADLSSHDIRPDGSGIVVKAWPLPYAISPFNGHIRINIVSNSKPCDVSLRQEIREDQTQSPVCVSIAGFIVDAGSVLRNAPPWTCSNVDLARNLDRQVIESIARITIEKVKK